MISWRTALPAAKLLTTTVGPNGGPSLPDERKYASDVIGLVSQLNIQTYGMSGVYPGWTNWHSSPLDGYSASHPASVMNVVDWYRNAQTVNGASAAAIPAAKLGVEAMFNGN